jgi:hypothetical protein
MRIPSHGWNFWKGRRPREAGGRRKFLATLGGAVAWALGARAEQRKSMRRVGVLMPFAANDPQVQTRNAAV